jgi:integrase
VLARHWSIPSTTPARRVADSHCPIGALPCHARVFLREPAVGEKCQHVSAAQRRIDRSRSARIRRPSGRSDRRTVVEIHGNTGLGEHRLHEWPIRRRIAIRDRHLAEDPNPLRDPRVRLPKERKPHIPPRLAEHVERVTETVAPAYVLPLLIIDECGPRVSELETCEVGDLDEHRRAIRVRWTFEKNERYRHLELPDDLYAALLGTLPPREDRELAAPLFPDRTDARLRMAITRACKATGTPHFSPHGLRRRRGSLHYKRTGSLAEVAELLGDSKRVAADHYVYALTDYREVDRSIVLTKANPCASEHR